MPNCKDPSEEDDEGTKIPCACENETCRLLKQILNPKSCHEFQRALAKNLTASFDEMLDIFKSHRNVHDKNTIRACALDVLANLDTGQASTLAEDVKRDLMDKAQSVLRNLEKH
jgi:hypothetical protein